MPRLVLILFVGFSALMCADPGFAADVPNIVLVMPDDMGWGDIGAHGNPLIKTPNLDRLHGESLRFTDFHVSPTCAPTRSALLTGRHEFKNGVTHTINERERLTLDAVTLAQVLKTAGYTTGIFGKWHLGDDDPHQPFNRGFDETFIHGCGGIGQSYPGTCGDFPGNEYFNPVVRHNGTPVRTDGYCTDVFFHRALDWMSDRGSEAKPFFAYITPNAPHSPLISPGHQYDELYEGKEINGKKLADKDVAYYSMITNIDENLGKLMGMLKTRNLEQNTLLIFMSDNGGTHTRLYSGGFRGQKVMPYYGGTHSPAFWRWPARISGGQDCRAMTAHIDILPTLMEVTGAKWTDPLRKQVEGRSLAPLLKDPGAEWADRTLVTHAGRWPKGQVAESKYRQCAIRNTRFTLVNNVELYDLVADPGQTMNVISEHPQVVAELQKAYDQWWSDIQPLLVNEDAPVPAVNPYKELYERTLGKANQAAPQGR
ncbi:Arylsulfatase [Caulifigura coniformis]|uniref:Arylsulfatase n=1 Tax=Caulifigura coniformis TaxID=2527983 RepID=A0A517SKG6_9PLAN|nr:arylsulfatase [Caulifigura coniformis]QDT56611.1 Arylsulfatase [Caulifigura coniformis]